MSDTLDRDHANAVLTLLHTALDPVPIAVYDGVVPSPFPDPAANPWLLVYFDASWPTDGAANTLDGKSATYVLTVQCHSTAASAAGARAIAGQARAALLNVRPTVAGRVCWPIRRVEGQPPNKDETLGFLVMDKVDVYELASAPG
jgi:hypothetical protein